MSAVHGVLIVDKAGGMTSHDVVYRARRALQTRAVGHAGTLDPMATGALVLACGHATRLLHYLTLDDKRYRATLQLGVGTDSLDADGTITEQQALPEDLSLARVAEVARAFVGPQQQRAPVLSAIKQGGEPLHRRVRRGETVEAPVRDVVVHDLTVIGVGHDLIEFEVHSGKGFYVRSLGRDLAMALGTVGHLRALRRLSSGPFDVSDAVPGKLLEDARDDEAARQTVHAALLSPLDALRDMPKVFVDAVAEAHLCHGRRAPLEHVARGPEDLATFEPGRAMAAVSESGRLLAIVEHREEQLAVLRGFPPPPADDQ